MTETKKTTTKKTKTVKAKSTTSSMKIAIADINAIVTSSAEVQSLKAEQNAKTRELALWLQNAQNELKKEQDKAKQASLLQQYNAVFAQKRTEIMRQYQEKLQIVSNSISKTIADEAQKKGYDIVLTKNMVVFGGVDITADIAKIVK